MKLTVLSFLIVSGFLGNLYSKANAMPNQIEVMVSVSDAFISDKFDATSNVDVIASGIFSNGCYRWKEARVEHFPAQFVHIVRSYASVYQGMCPMVLVPYTKEVKLGILGAGKHQIRFLNGDGTYMERTLVLK